MLREMFDARVGTGLEKALREDKEYMEIKEKTKQIIDRVDEIELTSYQWHVVDEALSASNERGSVYGRVAYYQGFKDAVNLLIESWQADNEKSIGK